MPKTESIAPERTPTFTEIQQQLREMSDEYPNYGEGMSLTFALAERAGWNLRFSCQFEDGTPVYNGDKDGLYFPRATRPALAIVAVYKKHGNDVYMDDLRVDPSITDEEYSAFCDALMTTAWKERVNVWHKVRDRARFTLWAASRCYLPLPKATTYDGCEGEAWKIAEQFGMDYEDVRGISRTFGNPLDLFRQLRGYYSEPRLRQWIAERPEMASQMVDVAIQEQADPDDTLPRFLSEVTERVIPEPVIAPRTRPSM